MKPVVAAVLGAMLSAPIQQIDVDRTRVAARDLASPATCRSNRILPDPSSRHIVVWNAPRDLRANIRTTLPGDFLIATVPTEPDTEAWERLVAVGGGARVEPIRWSDDGERLLLRVRDHGAAVWETQTGRLAVAPEMDPLWTLVRIETMSHGDTGFYLARSNLEQLRRIHREGEPMRSSATVGPNSATFLVFREDTGFRLTGYAGGRSWDTNVPIAFASSPLLPEGAARPQFLGDQGSYSSFLPYALPLVDQGNGRIIGRYGLDRIELLDGQSFELAPVFQQLLSIKDASANGETIFALVDLEREMRVARIRDGEVVSWRLCGKTGMAGGLPDVSPLNSLSANLGVTRSLIRFGDEPGSAASEPFGLLYRPRLADGRLVVYFHGGPTVSFAETTVPQVVSRLTAQGISVLAVEYSGMLGGGLPLSVRLPQLGIRALEQDVEAVTRWVRRSGFGRVALLGDSFGGAPAVVAAIRHEREFAHIFLRAPLLALRAPEETVRRGRMGGGQTAPESQLEFEHLVYGGPEGRARFAADLEDYVRRLRPSSRLSFYFGIHDPVSAAGDLPPSFEGHASVTIVRANHESVGAASSVWQDIIEKMGISPVARSSQPSNPPAQSRAGPHVFPPLNAVMRRNEAGTS